MIPKGDIFLSGIPSQPRLRRVPVVWYVCDGRISLLKHMLHGYGEAFSFLVEIYLLDLYDEEVEIARGNFFPTFFWGAQHLWTCFYFTSIMIILNCSLFSISFHRVCHPRPLCAAQRPQFYICFTYGEIFRYSFVHARTSQPRTHGRINACTDTGKHARKT